MVEQMSGSSGALTLIKKFQIAAVKDNVAEYQDLITELQVDSICTTLHGHDLTLQSSLKNLKSATMNGWHTTVLEQVTPLQEVEVALTEAIQIVEAFNELKSGVEGAAKKLGNSQKYQLRKFVKPLLAGKCPKGATKVLAAAMAQMPEDFVASDGVLLHQPFDMSKVCMYCDDQSQLWPEGLTKTLPNAMTTVMEDLEKYCRPSQADHLTKNISQPGNMAQSLGDSTQDPVSETPLGPASLPWSVVSRKYMWRAGFPMWPLPGFPSWVAGREGTVILAIMPFEDLETAGISPDLKSLRASLDDDGKALQVIGFRKEHTSHTPITFVSVLSDWLLTCTLECKSARSHFKRHAVPILDPQKHKT